MQSGRGLSGSRLLGVTMARKRNKVRSSRGRSSAVGLLFVLVAAVLLGICVGSYVGNEVKRSRRMTVHPAAPASPSHEVERERAPVRTAREVQEDEPRERETPHANEEQTAKTPRQDDASKNTALEAKATVSEAPRVHEASAPTARVAPVKHRRPQGLAGEVVHVPGTSKVAITLDAGASAAPTPSILETLSSHGLRVTFFLTGKWAEQNESLVRRIRQEGHEIGNHTYSHPDLRKLGNDKILEQLRKTDDIIAHITGKECDPYFRPPYGGRDKRVLSTVSDAGFTSIYWSLDSWDAFKKGITSKEITDRVLGRVQGGDIVLMHCGSQATADALPIIIRELEKRGLQIVPVSELLRK